MTLLVGVGAGCVAGCRAVKVTPVPSSTPPTLHAEEVSRTPERSATIAVTNGMAVDSEDNTDSTNPSRSSNRRIWKLSVMTDTPVRHLYYQWLVREEGKPDVLLTTNTLPIFGENNSPVAGPTPLFVTFESNGGQLASARSIVVTLKIPRAVSSTNLDNPFRGASTWTGADDNGRIVTQYTKDARTVLPLLNMRYKAADKRGQVRVRRLTLFLSPQPFRPSVG